MEKGKTIFVIEHGEYSDYRVVGVYSTRENAEKALAGIDRESSYHDGSISEWPIDPNIDQINQGLSPWKVQMKIDGNFSNAELLTNTDVSNIDSELFSELNGYMGSRFIFAKLWARDAAGAIKILNERRTQAIAEGRLIPEPSQEVIAEKIEDAKKQAQSEANQAYIQQFKDRKQKP